MEFNKALIDCMQTLRRRLREEQQLEIRLSQPDAITTMINACLVSSDELTRQMGRELASHSGVESAPEAPSNLPDHEPTERPVRIYRGQRVLA